MHRRIVQLAEPHPREINGTVYLFTWEKYLRPNHTHDYFVITEIFCRNYICVLKKTRVYNTLLTFYRASVEQRFM